MQFPVAVEIFDNFLQKYAYTSRLSIRQQISGSAVVKINYNAEKILTDSFNTLCLIFMNMIIFLKIRIGRSTTNDN